MSYEGREMIEKYGDVRQYKVIGDGHMLVKYVLKMTEAVHNERLLKWRRGESNPRPE